MLSYVQAAKENSFSRPRMHLKVEVQGRGSVEKMAPTLAYWKIRGLAQPLRLILGYTKTDFEDKTYESGDGPDFDRSCWTSVKNALGLDFPNLPYYIDGDVKITQSNAILRYLGRKYKLDGETDEEKRRVDIMENQHRRATIKCYQAMDFRNGFVRMCYNPNFDNIVDDYKKNIHAVLKLFSDFLGERKFFAGDKTITVKMADAVFPQEMPITMVDFVMYELLDQHKMLDASLLEPYANIVAFLKRFEEIPEIAEFQKSDKCFKGPINNKMAKFK